MPLPTPILDDRSYQQLRDELVRRIPVYNPEWTDHNASDPGITLIELFAFLGENLLFRFNQLPEATKLAFLRLLRVPLRPAVPARAMVAFTSRPTQPGGEPPRVELGSEARSGDLPWETLDEVTVAPLELAGVARANAPPPDPALEVEAADFVTASIDAMQAMGTFAEGDTPIFYVARRLPDDPSAPGALPVDLGDTVDGALWIAVLAPAALVNGAPPRPGAPPVVDPRRREALLAPFTADRRTLSVGFVPDLEIRPGDPLPDPCPGEVAPLVRTEPCRPPVQGDGASVPEIVWQASTPRLDPRGAPVYRTLTVVGDTTRGLGQQGVVRLELPRDPAELGLVEGLDPDAIGTGDLPPPLEGIDPAERRLLFWLRAYHRDPGHRLGRVLWVGANAAEALQRRRASIELLGTGNGQAGQTYRLQHRPVLERTLVVEVEDQAGGRWTRWSEVEGFEAAREDDKVFAVDVESGEVRFGNGVKGFAPQLGQRIRALEYRHGGGAAGNVGAGAIDRLASPAGGGGGELEVANPLPARGGAPAETIAAALERIPGELRRHDRAVSAGDFRELALATPGADLGRAEVLPLYDPRTGSTAAAGVVTVVVWPREDRQHPEAPGPDRTTLRQVCAWLDRRRLVTTELHVVAPRYRKVAVAVGVRVKPGHGVDAVRSWVERVVRQYLAPLPPHGPDGGGWPLGRAVYGPEIDAAVLQVDGVELVEPPGAGVAFLDAAGRWVAGAENRVALAAVEVPELAAIHVVNGPRLDPGTDFAPPSPSVPGGRIVPVPTIVEEC
jgi:hypothetical protein